MKNKSIRKMLAGLVFITVLTNTACEFDFNKKTDISPDKIEKISHIIDETDLRAESEVQNLSDQILSWSEEVSSVSENHAEFEKATLIRVVDGDTIVVTLNGEEQKVRLIGVDTPESVASTEYLEKTGKENTYEGFTASEYTKALLEDVEFVYLEKDTSDTDRYGRLLRYAWLEVPAEITKDSIATYMINGILLSDKIAKPVSFKPDVKYKEEFEDIYETYGDF
jgi:micrococcal nuclease